MKGIDVGDTVQLDVSSQYYDSLNADSSNPTDVTGVVLSVSDDPVLGTYYVAWMEGKHKACVNSYSDGDLILVDKREKTTPLNLDTILLETGVRIGYGGVARWTHYVDAERKNTQLNVAALLNRGSRDKLIGIAAAILKYVDLIDKDKDTSK